MKNSNSKQIPVYLLSGVFLTLLSISSCVDGSVQQIQDKANQLVVNRCKIEHIRTSIDVAWDSALSTLEKRLPAQIPSEEKETMLSLKSIKLLEMFNSYRQLPDSTKQIIDIVAHEDELRSKEIRRLSESSDIIEKQIDSLFLTMHSKRHQKVAEELISNIKLKKCNYHDWN